MREAKLQKAIKERIEEIVHDSELGRFHPIENVKELATEIDERLSLDIMKMRFIAMEVVEEAIQEIKEGGILKELPNVIPSLPEKIAKELASRKDEVIVVGGHDAP